MYDLKNKMVKTIFNLNNNLYHIIAWDLSNLVVTEYNSEYLGIINLDEKKIKYTIGIKKSLMCVKKILLNEKEELLITSGENCKDIFALFSSNAQNLAKSSYY